MSLLVKSQKKKKKLSPTPKDQTQKCSVFFASEPVCRFVLKIKLKEF